MSQTKIDELLVMHLPDLEAAMARLPEIEAKVASAIDKFTEEWCDSVGWASLTDFQEDEVWIASPDWKSALDEDYVGFITLEAVKGFSSQSWLSDICGINGNSGALRWYIEVPGLKGKTSKKAFNADYILKMREGGFVLEEKESYFYVPFVLDRVALASAITEDTIEEALSPYEAALTKVLAAKPLLDKMYKAARKAEL